MFFQQCDAASALSHTYCNTSGSQEGFFGGLCQDRRSAELAGVSLELWLGGGEKGSMVLGAVRESVCEGE